MSEKFLKDVCLLVLESEEGLKLLWWSRRLKSLREAWIVSNGSLSIHTEVFTKHFCDHTFTMGMIVHALNISIVHILNISSLFLCALPKIKGLAEVQQCKTDTDGKSDSWPGKGDRVKTMSSINIVLMSYVWVVYLNSCTSERFSLLNDPSKVLQVRK